MSYMNVDGWIVILADGRNPYVSWQNHLKRGSLGGVDCVAAIGTPIHAPADGQVYFQPNNGTGGNTISLYQGTQWIDQFMHCSRFNSSLSGGQSVKQGDLLGYTGATGGNYAPHLHWHRIYRPTGQRRNPWDYFTYTSIPAGGIDGIVEEKESNEEEEMIYDVLMPIAPSRGWLLIGPGYAREISATHWDAMKGALKYNLVKVNATQYDIIKANFLQGWSAADFSLDEFVQDVVDGVAEVIPGVDKQAVADAVYSKVAPRFDAVDDAIGAVADAVGEIEILPGPEPEPEPEPSGPTVGIDIAWPQMASNNAGIPFPYAQAKAEGVQFIGIKASGFNTGELYVADGYHEHVDGALAAGFDKNIFHYYVPGAGGIITQADWFVDNLYRYQPGHVIALDNEPLDDNAVFWTQDDVVAWHARVHERLGSNYNRHWNYFPAHLTRANQPWDRVEALGVKRWWAAYGDNVGGWEPDHEPSLQGSLTDWDVHQYTSKLSVAGRLVDGNYSRAALGELFG